MAANRYDTASPYSYVSLYVPIPFDDMVKLGTYYAAERKAAEEQLTSNIKTFGKFRSPSEVDTKRYYEESIGKFAPLVEEAAANPELMKSATFRAKLQNAYNTVNYANLSMLEESAANQRAGLEMRAKMKAEGRYKESWDLSDIANYDTLGSKRVFTDIAPVKYMNYNEMSNKYFDNLKAGDIRHVWKDGVRYREIGNTTEDLEQIYDLYENDLIDSPEGKMHLMDLKALGMNDEQTREEFRRRVIGSQMDRVIRPQLVVDQGYYTALRANAAGQPKVIERKPTRQENIGGDISKRVLLQYTHLPENKKDELNAQMLGVKTLYDEYNAANLQYQINPSNENLIKRNQAYYNYSQVKRQSEGIGLRSVMSQAFEDTAKFKLRDQSYKAKNYSRDGYLRGVNSALDAISDDLSLHSISDGGDALITTLGGVPTSRTQENGINTDMYRFGDSYGFMLSESIFQLGTGTQNEEPKRATGAFRGEKAGQFALRQALESGQFKDVEFIPQNKNGIFQYSTEYVDDYGQPSITGLKYIRGKLRIHAEQLEQLGTGVWTSAPMMMVTPFGRQTTGDAIKSLYNAREISYGEDGEKYYEIDVVRQLPIDADNDYWKDVNSIRENAPSHGGIGGASQTSDMQSDIERAAAYYNAQ